MLKCFFTALPICLKRMKKKSTSLDSETSHFNNLTPSNSAPSSPEYKYAEKFKLKINKLKRKKADTDKMSNQVQPLRLNNLNCYASSNLNSTTCDGANSMRRDVYTENILYKDDSPFLELYQQMNLLSFDHLNSTNEGKNLKTLPEIPTVSDFRTCQSYKNESASLKSKGNILQRRGSNNNLTLNVSKTNLNKNLSFSNYSVNNYFDRNSISKLCKEKAIQSNVLLDYKIKHDADPKLAKNFKKLLERRGSNTNLSLNIRTRVEDVNKFNSHTALNIYSEDQKFNRQRKCFSNSNLCLTGAQKIRSLSNYFLNTFDTDNYLKFENHTLSQQLKGKKYYSSENLSNISSHKTILNYRNSFGSAENIKKVNALAGFDNAKNITTEPLSPQTISEDFKRYLANLKLLHKASNLLREEQLNQLNEIFCQSYSRKKRSFSPSPENKFSLFKCKEENAALIKLHHEFWELPTNHQEKPLVLGSQQKNRYKTILPNEHSRVSLREENKSKKQLYINANFIKGHDNISNMFIATQGPMQNTTYEFWLMVYQNRKHKFIGLSKIVMLANFIENKRQTCSKYFPTNQGDISAFVSSYRMEDEKELLNNKDMILRNFDKEVVIPNKICFEPIFNFFLIQNLGICKKNGYSIRKLKIIFYQSEVEEKRARKTEEFLVFHYWFPDWPDSGSPDDIDILLDLSLDILDADVDFDCISEKHSKTTVNFDNCKTISESILPLPIIHCSAGIGRTGCFIAILNGILQIRTSIKNQQNIKVRQQLKTSLATVDILKIVCNLRVQRGGMVQNSGNYINCNWNLTTMRVLCQFWRCTIRGFLSSLSVSLFFLRVPIVF